MGKDFVKIVNDRIRINTIKRYKPMSDNKLIVRFSSNLDNKQSETFTFETTKERDDVVEILDLLCFK